MIDIMSTKIKRVGFMITIYFEKEMLNQISYDNFTNNFAY